MKVMINIIFGKIFASRKEVEWGRKCWEQWQEEDKDTMAKCSVKRLEEKDVISWKVKAKKGEQWT